MITSINIIKTDLKNILRDPSLVLLLFVPFLITALLRWGYPLFLAAVPDAAPFNMLLLGMLSMTCAAMPGLAVAFAILDERDNGLLPVLMTLPVGFKKIVLNRLLAIYFYGTAAAFIAIVFSGLSEGTILQDLPLSFLAASPAAVMTLVPAFFAANKIEGATIAKMMNFMLIFRCQPSSSQGGGPAC
jgi:fluoroquinolone transport system permease protein